MGVEIHFCARCDFCSEPYMIPTAGTVAVFDSYREAVAAVTQDGWRESPAGLICLGCVNRIRAMRAWIDQNRQDR